MSPEQAEPHRVHAETVSSQPVRTTAAAAAPVVRPALSRTATAASKRAASPTDSDGERGAGAEGGGSTDAAEWGSDRRKGNASALVPANDATRYIRGQRVQVQQPGGSWLRGTIVDLNDGTGPAPGEGRPGGGSSSGGDGDGGGAGSSSSGNVADPTFSIRYDRNNRVDSSVLVNTVRPMNQVRSGERVRLA